MMTFLNSESAASKTCDETASLLKSDTRSGLSNDEVLTRRKLYGLNEFEIKHEDPLWKKYLEKVRVRNVNITNKVFGFVYDLYFKSSKSP
jgi:Ca2+-transporting ATPase